MALRWFCDYLWAVLQNHERQRDDDIQADKGFQHQPQSHRPSQAQQADKHRDTQRSVQYSWLRCRRNNAPCSGRARQKQISSEAVASELLFICRFCDYKSKNPRNRLISGIFMELLTRFELVTSSLPRMCSTTWAIAANSICNAWYYKLTVAFCQVFFNKILFWLNNIRVFCKRY